MPASTQDRRSAQGSYAAAVRWRKPDQDQKARDFAFARLEDYIRQTVEAAPPLTDDQRSRLALLLRGGTAA